MSGRGVFLVLDGVDGSGKSTQVTRLVARIEGLGRRPIALREPGSTALGEALRELLLHRELGLVSAAETLLFAAARRQLLEQAVEPALAQGHDVILDRFHASTYAYQGVARGQDPAKILALLDQWAGRPAPDLELILRLEPQEAARRRSRPADRIEALGTEFQERVAAGYEQYARVCPRAVLIDALGTPREVEQRIDSALRERLGGALSVVLKRGPGERLGHDE